MGHLERGVLLSSERGDISCTFSSPVGAKESNKMVLLAVREATRLVK